MKPIVRQIPKMSAVLFSLVLLFTLELQAQVMTDSETDNSLLSSCGLFSTYQVDVNDFLRYTNTYPKYINVNDDDSFDMELKWGNTIFNSDMEAGILQIKLSAHQIQDMQIPLNICVVVDKSASMRDHHRMEKVKVALKEFLKMLRPDDYASIVVYDDNATVLLPAQKISEEKYNDVSNLIDSIKTGMRTNMFSGMVLGYKEVQKYYDPQFANRVILLTDGITNCGVTDPEEISKQSKLYNSMGIDISTIGVGTDINFALLNSIADEGRGLSHFIGDCDSIQNDVTKVFNEEFESMQAIVKNPIIEISYPKQYVTSLITGHESLYHKKTIRIPIKSLYQGVEQVNLIQFMPNNRKKHIKKPIAIDVSVKLSFFDVLRQKRITKTKIIQLIHSNISNLKTDMLKESDVKNNYYTTLMASLLKKATSEFEAKRYNVALHTINSCLSEVESKFDTKTMNSHANAAYQLLLHQQNLLKRMLYRSK